MTKGLKAYWATAMNKIDQNQKDEIARHLRSLAGSVTELPVLGRVTKILGSVIRASLSDALIGEECILVDPVTKKTLHAAVIGMDKNEVILVPSGSIDGLSVRAQVVRTGRQPMAPCGKDLLGRVVDAFGEALDGKEKITTFTDLKRDPPQAMKRTIIDTPFETRIRAIDGMLTIGRGQRIGIFGSAGVGKSVLLSEIIKGALVDVIVVGLIGERGREVAEFIQNNLGAEGLKKACLFVATADRPPAERLRAAYSATAAAEQFRDEGLSVLLLIDSATRVARATREIGLAAGELPVRRGFPPSTFTLLPELLERAGTSDKGAITAIYTVLVEGDNDDADPVADELRSLLDGHIILSRKLAAKNHYPAIDVSRSKSRVMGAVVDAEHGASASKLGSYIAKLNEIELLLQVGEYKPGGDPLADIAVEKQSEIFEFLQQTPGEFTDFQDSKSRLIRVVS
ncbi:flagellum-specific ATP synthase [Roseibium sp. TrichSKD4]|nr:flagellum-specific ATP synthase [Roseibium sp. TrichSKD4]